MLRLGRRNRRKDNTKLHIAINIRRNIIVEYKLTSWRRNDSPQLKFLLSKIDALLRVLGDAGYLSRKNCDIVVEKSGKPFFALKSDTTAKAKGSTAWKRMIRFATKKKKLYDAIYHLRSLVEAVFSAIKRRYGNSVRATTRKSRNTMIALRVLAFNIKQRLYDATARKLGLPFWVKCDQ